ncbi:hypothetical protein PFISCL1PPCAC_19036, partial [Pristionchus fissidentatus]
NRALSFLLLTVVVVVAATAADNCIYEQVKAYFWSESSTDCSRGTNITCTGTTFYSYHDCCKDTACCLKLQGWVVFIIVSLVVSILISCVASIISCLCCCCRSD